MTTRMVSSHIWRASMAVFFCMSTSAEVAERRIPEELQAVKQSQPRLFELSEQACKELRAIFGRDNYLPDAARRQEMAQWSKTIRTPEESSFIVTTLLEAYEKETPDWPVVSVALLAAIRGVPDPRVVKVAEELLASAAELPDEAMVAVASTPIILALSGKKENCDLLTKATSRAFVGVKVESGDQSFVGGAREVLCQQALVVLFQLAPLDDAIVALRDVRDMHKATTPGFDEFIGGSAEHLLQYLERVKKGEKVPLSTPG